MKVLKSILEQLSAPISESHLSIGEFVYHPHKAIFGDLKRQNNPNSIYKSLGRAEKDNLIKKRKIKGETYVALTNLGRKRLAVLKLNPDFKIETNPEEWDEIYRIVYFDFPEKDRLARDLLRKKLKEIGFVGWQKSVWVGKEDIYKELREFLKKSNLEDYVLIVETKDLGNDKLSYFLSNK